MSEFMNKQGTGDLGVLGGYGRCSSQCAASSLEIPLTPTQYFSLLCDSSGSGSCAVKLLQLQ